MATAKEQLEKANFVYYYSVTRSELEKAEAELSALLKQSWLSEDNAKKAEMLLWRTQAKKLALIYFEEGYDSGDAAAAADFAEQKQKLSEQKGYAKTALVLSAVARLIRQVDEVMRDADEQACKVRTYSWKAATASDKECRKVQAVFRKKAEEIEKIVFPDPLFNKGVKFPDVRAELLHELKKVEDFADKLAFELECKNNKDIISGVCDLRESTEWKYYEFTAQIDKSQRLPGTVFLCTPFMDEAELFVVQNSSSPVYVLERSALAGRSEAGLKKSFEIFARQGATLMITGLNGYEGENKKIIYAEAAAYGKGGHRVYVIDESGDHELYSEAAAIVNAEDICFRYLTMPGFTDVKEFLRERGMIEDSAEDEKFMRDYLTFMGYVGLNLAVKERSRDRDWRAAVRAHVRGRLEQARDYIEKLPSQSQLIDSGWGDFSKMVHGVPGTKAEFNYDDVSQLDITNVKNIMNAPVTFYQRCGMLVTYCCGAGADASEWKSVELTEKQERVELATRLLLRAMGVEVKGRVEFHDRIPGASDAEGVCCNGGQVIKYKNGLLKKDFSQTVHTVAHECMHALQFQAKNTGWSKWLYDDLGVTSSRVEEWILNYDHQIDEPYNSYRNQILEADAEAFAYDCERAIKDVWHTMNFR